MASDFWGTIGTGGPVPWPNSQFRSKPSLHTWMGRQGGQAVNHDDLLHRATMLLQQHISGDDAPPETRVLDAIKRVCEQLRIATDQLQAFSDQGQERYPGEMGTFAHDALIQMSVVE